MKKAGLILISSVLCIIFILPWMIPIETKEDENINLQPWPESKFTYLYGNKIHYRQFQADSTIPYRGKILLVHGFAGSTFVFRKLFPRLQKSGYSVCAMDLPAYGYSERNIKTHQLPDALLAYILIRSLDQQTKDYSPWTLCGHSMGASVVYDMAAHYPQICSTLILINGVAALRPGNMGTGGFITNPFFLRWTEVFGRYYFFTPETIRKLLHSAYASKPDAEAVEGYLRPLKIPGTARAIVYKFRTAPALDSVRISQDLDTRIIWGTEDSWIPLSVGKKFHAEYPFTRLDTIKDAGHCPMETHPDEIMELIMGEISAK